MCSEFCRVLLFAFAEIGASWCLLGLLVPFGASCGLLGLAGALSGLRGLFGVWDLVGPSGDFWGLGAGAGVALAVFYGILRTYFLVSCWCLRVMLFLVFFFCTVKDEGLLYELLVMKRIQFLFSLALRV